jgi:hypothetical protein
MSIGPDIKNTLVEVGSSYTILRDSGNITGEHIWTKPNAQVTKPFIREFFLEGWFSYDTEAVVGDILEMDTSGKKFLVMNKTPDLLENQIYRYSVVLYMCNIVADVLRPTDQDPDDRWRVSTEWSYVARGINCLITTPLYGHELTREDEIGFLEIEVYEMYAATSIGIQALDRIRISSNQYYKVETVKPWRYEGVDVFELREDTREMATTTSTTTTTTTTTTV